MSSHALYRFWGVDDELLYIGITMDPAARWKAHAKDKPWWDDVAKITVEPHPSRGAVLRAERDAIHAEAPRYNVIHNGPATTRPVTTTSQAGRPARFAPFQVGDWGAFGLRDGRCPIGKVEAYDETWVSVRRKTWGWLDTAIVAFRWDEIEAVELAYLEDAERDSSGWTLMPDEHLSLFQDTWGRVRENPIDAAKRQAIREENEAVDRMTAGRPEHIP